jgi:hypothetical protein
MLREEQLQAKLIPSEMKSESLQGLQHGSSRRHILCNRPDDLAPTIPVTLLHPILNEFNNDCETYHPRVEDYRFARDLSAMSCFYTDELERRGRFLKICQDNGFKIDPDITPGPEYRTDGSIISNEWPCLIAELKNEAGSTGAEPVFQTAAYYRAYLRGQGVGQSGENANITFPCIGLYVIGGS